MIAILDNVINILTLQLGFILGGIIHLLLTPLGAVTTVLLWAYLEYIIIKSISKDIRLVTKYVNYAFRNKINAFSALNTGTKSLVSIVMSRAYLLLVISTVGLYSLLQTFVSVKNR